MSVTASRLGAAPLSFDWSHLSPSGQLSRAPGELEAANQAWTRLKARFGESDVGFYDAPTREELSQAAESVAAADKILKSGRFTDCLFLGIGGSALGPISLLSALQERRKTGAPRIHFMENPDPLEWKSTLAGLQPDSTLVCAVTKSGGTFETLAQLLLALEWLGRERLTTHLLAITDPAKGDLRSFAQTHGITTLNIAPAMGGRFSIFTPVGLFPAALAGLEVGDFLQGARQVREYIEKTPLEKNPIFILGQELVKQYDRRGIHVCMPYSTRLRSLGDWFVQLWGESLGKDGKGFTPLAAVGAIDQHSILQLLRDGPDDKVTLFLTVDRVDDEVKIPKLSVAKPGTPTLPAFRLLEGHTLHHLLRVEYQATSLVLTKQGRPNATLQIERLDERCLGALYFALAVLTAFTGTLWDINPFDQPGVEEGKIYTRDALSQKTGAPRESEPLREWEDNSPVGRLRRERETPNS